MSVKEEAGKLLASYVALQKALSIDKPFVSVNGVEIANPTLIRCISGFVRIVGMSMALTTQGSCQELPRQEKEHHLQAANARTLTQRVLTARSSRT